MRTTFYIILAGVGLTYPRISKKCVPVTYSLVLGRPRQPDPIRHKARKETHTQEHPEHENIPPHPHRHHPRSLLPVLHQADSEDRGHRNTPHLGLARRPHQVTKKRTATERLCVLFYICNKPTPLFFSYQVIRL